MRTARIRNKDVYIATVNCCTTARSRRIGLLRSIINEYSGILMTIPLWRRKMNGIANSIHMIGMQYPIFVVWIGENYSVVHTVVAEPGLHFYLPPCGASYIAELHVSKEKLISTGDVLTIDFKSGLDDADENSGLVFLRKAPGII